MGIGSVFASLQDAFGSMASRPVSSFSLLETTVPDMPYILVGKDGSLATILKIDGIKQVMGPDEFVHATQSLSLKMSSYFSHPGHAIQVWFSRDPDLAGEVIRQQVAPQRAIASQLGLDLTDLFAEREKNLPNFIVHESYYIAIWTRLTALTKQEQGRAKLTQKPPSWWPVLADTQDMFRAAKPLRDRHVSLVRSFVSDLANVSIRSEVLDSHRAITAARSALDPTMVGSDWRPTLVGDKVSPRHPEIKDGDLSHFLWPRIDDQLFKRDALRINPRIVEMNGRYMAGVDMTVGPQDLMPFSELVTRMIQIEEFPWRVSFLLESGGLDNMGFKRLIASVMTITNSENRAIKNAILALQDEQSQNGVVVAKLRTSFCTWAPIDENGIGLIEERLSRLQRAVESWGFCSVSATAGDPLAGVMSSSMGLQPASTAPAGAVPLSAAISMLPLDRDASPWTRGAILFRTPDGRVWPYAPGSSNQDSYVDLIMAPSGKGKSVLLNSAMLARCLSPTATQGVGGAKLPRMAIIDIGRTSSGLISLLKESLPASRRHEAEYMRMKNDPEHAINPFDTQLGCRKPSAMERTFLINFLSALGTPVGHTSPPDNLSDLAGFCVDEIFTLLSDKSVSNSRPRRYAENFDRTVDATLRKHHIAPKPGMTWWDVVDALFARGDYHGAVLAQRHAVPRLDDIPAALQADTIRDIYGDAKIEGGEGLIVAFNRLIISALKEYPVLSRPTMFDIGEARVVALDIEEVAPRGGGPADKQTALMYMLARYVLARDYYVGLDLLDAKDHEQPLVQPAYRDYHERRIRRLRESPKFISYDEFHRTSGSTAIRQQAIVDMREGRKYGVQIALASQFLSDFDPNMINLASGYWILGVGTDNDAKEAREIFGLSNTAYDVMRYDLTGPGPKGAPFLVVMKLKDGKHEHFLYNTLGPTEVWAFSTTTEDTALRGYLYEALGAVEARRRLSIVFPTGSCKSEYDNRVERLSERGERTQSSEKGIVEMMANEIINRIM